MKSAQKSSANNSTLIVLSFIMLINALAYGIIIPLLYPYAKHFGIDPFSLSMLFASFSLAQFIATPILGRLSDKYGRKPVLLFCLFGTSLSLALFASATNVVVLFISRIIDGITGGNISVAQAIIADSTKGNERAKGFALLGASFGFGFLVGPGLGGLLSNFGLTAPFWFASGLALVGTLLGTIILKETLPAGKREHPTAKQPLFRFKSLFLALFTPLTGIILLIGFLSSIAQNAFIIGVQAYMNDILALTPTVIGFVFVGFGIINIITQVAGIRILLRYFAKKKIVVVSTLLAAVTMVMLAFETSATPFIVTLFLYGIVLSPQVPVVTGLLSENTKAEDQGGILGINQSYMSLGQVIGPLLAGAVAANFGLSNIFLVGGLFFAIALISTAWLKVNARQKFDL